VPSIKQTVQNKHIYWWNQSKWKMLLAPGSQ